MKESPKIVLKKTRKNPGIPEALSGKIPEGGTLEEILTEKFIKDSRDESLKESFKESLMKFPEKFDPG